MSSLQIGFLCFQGGLAMEICYSPLAGKAVNLDQVADEMFSGRMLGDGMAVDPQAKEIYSPVAGEITMVYETQHAIGIKTDGGNEILCCTSASTPSCPEGKPFSTKVQVGDHVQPGDLLTVVDWDYIKRKVRHHRADSGDQPQSKASKK